VVKDILKQTPDGADHLLRRYDPSRELEDQALYEGLSLRRVPERKAHSEIIEKVLKPRITKSGQLGGDIYAHMTMEEDRTLLRARHFHKLDLDKLSKIVGISATRLSTRERDARIRVSLFLEFENYLPTAEIEKMGITGTDVAYVSLMYRSSIADCGPAAPLTLEELEPMRLTVTPELFQIIVKKLAAQTHWHYGRRAEDALIPSLEPSRIRTAVTRLIERLPQTVEGRKKTRPALAILRGRLEEYNRQTRSNNKENWRGLRDIIDDLVEAQQTEYAAKMGLTYEQFFAMSFEAKVENFDAEFAMESRLTKRLS
jgi:hypothetical protein